MSLFHLESSYEPAGDQPAAIRELNAGLVRGDRHQVLLGVAIEGDVIAVGSKRDDDNSAASLTR